MASIGADLTAPSHIAGAGGASSDPQPVDRVSAVGSMEPEGLARGWLFTVSTALGGRVALLEDMVISPGTRGRGIGTALLNEAVAVGRSSGCLRITLLTDALNESALRFYVQRGFNVSSMVPLRILL